MMLSLTLRNDGLQRPLDNMVERRSHIYIVMDRGVDLC